MHIAVAIVAFRNLEDIRGCLAALERSVHRDFEVVICENGGPIAFERLSAAVAPELAEGQRVTCILAPGNLGYAGGVNMCMAAAATADAWWVLNPDTQPDEGALQALIKRLEVGDCDAVGGVVHTEAGTVQSFGGRWRHIFARAVSLGHGEGVASAERRASSVEAQQNYLNGACMLVSRRFFELTGPMREDYFLYCEEVEWCLRAVSRGMRLGFTPAARVVHFQGTTTGNPANLRKQARLPVYLNERNRLLLTRDRAPLLLPIAATFALTLIFLRFARRGAWRQVGYAVSGWLAGLAGRRGPPEWA